MNVENSGLWGPSPKFVVACPVHIDGLYVLGWSDKATLGLTQADGVHLY